MKLKISEMSKVPNGIKNEDDKKADRSRYVFLVADGIGGNPAGDEASKFAVNTTYNRFKDDIPYIRKGTIKEKDISSHIEQAIKAANEGLYGLSSSVMPLL